MGIKNAGENFPLHDDSRILEINSPQNSVGGPYVVVYKNMEERWAIVALDWDEEPCLGIRWFWGSSGNPISTTYAIWLVIPNLLKTPILSALPLDTRFRKKLDDFLTGKIQGTDLG